MQRKVRLYTLGYMDLSACEFFAILNGHLIRTVFDIRRNRTSRKSGFARKGDLEYFLSELTDVAYEHRLDLAPPAGLARAVRQGEIAWREFEDRYLHFLREKRVERRWSPSDLHQTCFLAEAAEPLHCPRRIIADYFAGLGQAPRPGLGPSIPGGAGERGLAPGAGADDEDEDSGEAGDLRWRDVTVEVVHLGKSSDARVPSVDRAQSMTDHRFYGRPIGS